MDTVLPYLISESLVQRYGFSQDQIEYDQLCILSRRWVILDIVVYPQSQERRELTMLDKTSPAYQMRRDIRIFQPLLLTRVIWQLRKWDLIFSEQASQHYMQTLVQITESMILIDSESEVGQIMARLIQATKESQEATMQLIEALP